jgi:hypothetical protein
MCSKYLCISNIQNIVININIVFYIHSKATKVHNTGGDSNVCFILTHIHPHENWYYTTNVNYLSGVLHAWSMHFPRIYRLSPAVGRHKCTLLLRMGENDLDNCPCPPLQISFPTDHLISACQLTLKADFGI